MESKYIRRISLVASIVSPCLVVVLMVFLLSAHFHKPRPLITVYNIPGGPTDGTSSFETDGSYVYYQSRLISGADSVSFRPLDIYYEEDVHAIYDSTGGVVVGADPKSFVILGGGFAKDTYHVFDQIYDSNFTIKVISNDPTSFTILNSTYEKDKNTVFNNDGSVLVGADAATFKPLISASSPSVDTGYAEDKNNVYWDGTVVAGADTSTFKLVNIGSGYGSKNVNYDAYDKNHQYSQGEIYTPGQ
jgi:hypothetical protein